MTITCRKDAALWAIGGWFAELGFGGAFGLAEDISILDFGFWIEG
jgi:hypothetical protein